MQEEIQLLKAKSDKAYQKYQNKKYEFEKAEAIPQLRKMIGKCFKYKNGYGGGEAGWFLYNKVVALDEVRLKETLIK